MLATEKKIKRTPFALSGKKKKGGQGGKTPSEDPGNNSTKGERTPNRKQEKRGQVGPWQPTEIHQSDRWVLKGKKKKRR